MRVALIGCGKRKRKGIWKARDLYTSNRFQMTLRYCEIHYDRVYVLSAKYGLLDLDRLIEEYDETLGNMSRKERQKWAKKVRRQIERVIAHDAELHFYCGKLYCEGLERMRKKVNVPLRGMSIGEQLAWLKSELWTTSAA